MVLQKDYSLWLLNPSDHQMDVTAGEICGFGTGSYDEGIIRT